MKQFWMLLAVLAIVSPARCAIRSLDVPPGGEIVMRVPGIEHVGIDNGDVAAADALPSEVVRIISARSC